MSIAVPGDPAHARNTYRLGKSRILDALADGGSSSRGIRRVLQRLARHADATLQLLWQQANLPASACLVAAGGYGRGELFPHSDIDVLVLLPDDADLDADVALKAHVEAFIGRCWDSGMEIGSSVRSVTQCVEEATRDVTVQTSLLEARCVAGARRSFVALQKSLAAVLDPKAFFIAKTLEMRQRHNKFENTPYSLEPNCKESPGGLRDLQVVLWVARAAGLGGTWDELAQSGLATAFEVRQIKANESLLSLIRARLHIVAGRREDRLVFDLQTAVAETFGYVAPTLSASRDALPPEGAVFPRGGPSENLAPTLSASRDALPPEGAVFPRGGPSENLAPTLSASRDALPPEGAELRSGRPVASFVAPTLVASRTALPPEGAELRSGRPVASFVAPTLSALRDALPSEEGALQGTGNPGLALASSVSPGTRPLEKRAWVRPSEALMRRYYWAAKAVTQLNLILLLNIEERLNPNRYPLRPINPRFFDKAGMLEVASDDLYVREPHAILETFLVYETTVGLKGLSARTLRALYNARHVMSSRFRDDPVNRDTFRRILQQPQGITHAMRLMNQTSVLGRYLWVFRKIVGQMQHDLFHVYTVDQHILMVLRNVRRFFMAEHSHEYPMCSQLAAGWDKPWILYIAALFHDIAKGRGGDHSELGCRDVRVFCRQHGIDREDSRLAEFLVGQHLTMSRIAQKEDLSDPEVIAAFARRVRNERNLTALYLLTVADIRGTSPKVWNAWKGKLLEDLYRYTLRVLGGRAPDAGTEVESRKREALTTLALHAEPFEAHVALWNTLDVSYFMRHDAADIAWHARQLSRHVGKGAGCVVRARRSLAGEGMQVLVYTPDAPDLFARICGYFDQAGFSILDAKVHTAKNGYALDTFQVVSPELAEHYRELANIVEAELNRTISQPGPLPAPGKGRVSRRVRSFPVAPRVDLQPDEKGQRWLLTVSASDRVGLLYLIARVLARHRINLQLAKITTLGERVEDSFLIDGPELQQNRAQIAIETELLEALQD